MVVTPTASGKTLCYNLPVLDRILKDPDARALYLFPTKALAQDQLAELHAVIEAIGADIGTFTYDGDTPQDARKSIRARAHVVVTNPDMLHKGILPHHTKWVKLLENLRYVVVDELHSLRGVYGSHVANIFRRLRRLCEFYGSRPQFICSSATIGNPKELAEALTEREMTLVDRSGAPRGERYFAIYNPPVVNRQLGIRKSALNSARDVSLSFLGKGLQTIVFAPSRLATEVLVTYLKEALETKPGSEGIIRGYRGGYLPLKRREIERGLREGSVLGVVSTNALELGIDIGSLDAAVLVGYPGSVASAWQQAGRAGRRTGTSVAVLVANSTPLNQFIAKNPDYFFGSPVEQGRVNPDNLQILVNHIKCAAFELPFVGDEPFGKENLLEILKYLEEEKLLHRAGERWHWTSDSYPADAISLRSVSSDNFVIQDVTAEPRIIAEVDYESAPSMVHEKAIYILEGRTYFVEKYDHDERRVHVREAEVDYYTDAITYTKVRILERFAEEPRRNARRNHGEVHVTSQVVGFKKIKFHTNENVGSGELDDARERDAHDLVLAHDPARDRAGPALLARGAAGRGGGALVHARPARRALPDVRPARPRRRPRRQRPGRGADRAGPPAARGGKGTGGGTSRSRATTTSRTSSSTTPTRAASASPSRSTASTTGCSPRAAPSSPPAPAPTAARRASGPPGRWGARARQWPWRSSRPSWHRMTADRLPRQPGGSGGRSPPSQRKLGTGWPLRELLAGVLLYGAEQPSPGPSGTEAPSGPTPPGSRR